MAKVSRAYIKGTGADQSGSIQPGSTIYAQDILDLIDSAKWHDEGIESVYYDYENNGIKVVKSSDPNNPVFISVPRNSDIVNKLVKGVDKYELHSDSGLVAKTDLPSTLVTSVACDKDANELQVSSTSSDSGITVPLPDSLKSVAIEGNTLTFTSLDGTPTTIDLPDSLKSVTIEGNELTFTSLDGVPSTIDLPITTGYLSDVSLADGTLTFTKEGASDVNVTLPFISKAITGVSLQGSNLVFTFSDDTVANIALPTQSEGGTTAGLLSGVRIDGNKLIFTVSGGDDITITLPSTSVGSGDVDLTGLLLNPSYSLGSLTFDTKDGSTKTVNLDGIANIHRNLSGDYLDYEDLQGTLHQVSLSSLTRGVLTGVKGVSAGNLLFTAKDSDDVSVPLSNLTASGVLTGVALSSDGNSLVFSVKDSGAISIPLSGGASSGVKDVEYNWLSGLLSVTYSDESRRQISITPGYNDMYSGSGDLNFGWGGSLGVYGQASFRPLWVPTALSYMDPVLKSSVSLTNKEQIPLTDTTRIEIGTIHGRYYNPPYGNTTDTLDFVYCDLPFEASLSESSGTFTANVITRTDRNFDYVLMDSANLNVYLNGNIFEALPSSSYTTVVHLLQKSDSLSRFRGFAYKIGDIVILIDKYMFFAKQAFDWSYNVTNSFGMRFYLSRTIERYSPLPFTAVAGKVLE